MGDGIFSKNCTFLLAALTLLSSFLLSSVMAKVYTVGDQEEWSSQTNYALWAEGYNFSLGDVLGTSFNLFLVIVFISYNFSFW